MSPNSSSHHHLDSYQHLGVGAGGDGRGDYDDADGYGTIEVGVGTDADHHRRYNDHDDECETRAKVVENSSSSLSCLLKRAGVASKGSTSTTRVVSLAAVLLSFGTGWLAADGLFRRTLHHHHDHRTSAQHQRVDDNIPDLIWSDEFDGDSVDLTKWTFVNGNGCDIGLCGWGNAELEWYTPSNARVSDGKLYIEARKFKTPDNPSVNYTSSKIISKGKADFGDVVDAHDFDNVEDDDAPIALERSRRFESRLKLPWGIGIWPAFWMLPTYDTYGGWPKSGEIDIMENIGKEGPNTVHGTVHYGLDWPRHQYSESGVTVSSSSYSSSSHDDLSSSFRGGLNETYHTYAVERLPGELRWYVDDILYSIVTEEDVKPYHWSFDEEFYFILNLAVGGSWPGDPLEEDGPDGDATSFPQTLVVDYVRVYEGIFPRIVGRDIVGCSERDVVYEVVNVKVAEKDDVPYYAWEVPQNATIKEGQGSPRIVVDFASIMPGSHNIIDSEMVRVRANYADDRIASTSAGPAKLDDGIGIRVKIIDLDGKCPSSASAAAAEAPPSKEFNFDCGRPSTCTPYVLHRTTEEFTCGERIEWLVEETGMDELDACREVGYEQFHGHCGPCNPLV